MKPLLPLLALAALLAGCAPHPQDVRPTPDTDRSATSPAAAAPEKTVDEEKAQLPDVELTPHLLYRFLLAEVAAQRGKLPEAAALYGNLAVETHDPRIARRATEIALHARRLDIALAAARLWRDAEPGSPQARQTLIRLLAAQGQFDELKAMIVELLKADAQHLDDNLVNLNRLFSSGGDRKAIRTLVDDVTAPYLDHAQAHYARAVAAFEAGELVAARQAIGQALALKPDWEAAALLRVQLIADRAEALRALGDFVAANPQAQNARITYARALVNDKRFVEARREFNALLDRQGAHPDGDLVFAVAMLSLQLKDSADAERQLRRLVEIGHPEADRARFYLGQIAEEDKRWDEALRWFDAVGAGELYLPARLHGASVLAKQGRLDDARRRLKEAEATTPRERAELLIGEAQLLREAGRLEAAHAVLVAGLAQQPDQPELIYETALLAEKMGHPEELETRLRHLIKIQPDHAHALNALGYSLADRNVRLDEARKLIERALEIAPGDPFILDSEGWVLFRQGKRAAALDALNKAFGIRADPEIAAHLGEVLWSLGRQDEARATWEKARQDAPDNAVLGETIKRLLH